MKRVAWFLSIAAHNWLSSRRWEIQNWICSGWKGIEILPHLVQKLGKSFPNFLCLGITGCSKYHSHWQFSLPALCRSAKRQKRQPFSFSSILSFLPCFFTFPARITRRPPITPHTGVPSSCYLLQLNLMPSSQEGSQNPSREKPQREVLVQPTPAASSRPAGQRELPPGYSCSQGQPLLHSIDEKPHDAPGQRGSFWVTREVSTPRQVLPHSLTPHRQKEAS